MRLSLLVQLRSLLAAAVLLTAPTAAVAQLPAWQWGLQSTNPTPADGTDATGRAVATDAAGRVYVGGTYGDEYGPVPATRTFGSTGATLGPGLGGFVAQASAAGQWAWVTPAVATGVNTFGRTLAQVSTVATTPAGDLYAAGFASGTTLTVGTLSQPLGTTGDAVWVARFNSAGVCQWLRVVANGRDEPQLAADPSTGGVVLGGIFQQPISFGSTTLLGAPGGRTRTMYVARLSAAGQWTSAASSAGVGRIGTSFAFAVGPAGQVAVGASYSGGFVRFDNITLFAPTASAEVYCVAQLSATNQWDWAIGGNGGSYSAVAKVAYTPSGELWAAGSGTSGTVVGPATIATATPGGTLDLGGFAGRLSAAGQWLVARTLASGTTGVALLGPLAVDASGTAVLLGGVLGVNGAAQVSLDGQLLNAPNGTSLFFVSTLNTAGRWGAVVPMPQPALAEGLNPTAVALDAAGGLYVAGGLSGGLTLGSSLLNGTTGAINNINGDVLLARLPAATTLPARAATPAGGLACFPSPARGVATLRLPGSHPQARPITLTDALGRAVRRVTLPAHATQAPLDLAGLAPGLYLARCGAATGRVVVE